MRRARADILPRAALSLLLGLSAGATAAVAEISVPSGQSANLHEMFLEPQESGEVIFRLRYLTPEISREGGQMKYADVEADFQHLCESDALPKLHEAQAQADTIVISMMDRVVEFGASDPDATQFFEVFRHNFDTCIWEAF